MNRDGTLIASFVYPHGSSEHGSCKKQHWQLMPNFSSVLPKWPTTTYSEFRDGSLRRQLSFGSAILLFIIEVTKRDQWTFMADASESSDMSNGERQLAFLGLLSRVKALHCSNSRDRIYAFLGSLAARFGPENELLLVPNYDKPEFDVYLDFTVRWLEQTRDLSILSTLHHNHEAFAAETPSWVTRWNLYIVNDEFELHNCHYDASRGSLQKRSIVFPGDEATQLKLRGFLIDSVNFSSEPYFRAGGLLQGIPLPARLRRWMMMNYIQRLWAGLLGSTARNAYVDKDPLWVFCRALSAKGSEGNPSDFTAHEATFGSWLCGAGLRTGGADMKMLKEASWAGSIDDFMNNADVWDEHRRFIVTEAGYYGLAPTLTRKGMCAVSFVACEYLSSCGRLIKLAGISWWEKPLSSA